MGIELQSFTIGDHARFMAWTSSTEAPVRWAGNTFTHPLSAEQFDQYLAVGQSGRHRFYGVVDRANDESNVVWRDDVSDRTVVGSAAALDVRVVVDRGSFSGYSLRLRGA